jgi:hypothetical protein
MGFYGILLGSITINDLSINFFKVRFRLDKIKLSVLSDKIRCGGLIRCDLDEIR